MPNKQIILFTLLIALAIGTIWVMENAKNSPKDSDQNIVNIYSYRQPQLIAPLLAQFEAETGIKTQVIFAKKGLLERIKIEGAASPADIILTSDIGLLAQSAAVAQSVSSPLLENAIPAHLRDPDNLWFGLSIRARVAFVSKTRVGEADMYYTDLAQPHYKGRLCMRSGQHPYNIALFAALLIHLGEAEFVRWLEGVKNNLAQSPSGNDRAQVRNIYGGKCDIALGNTYYMGKMLRNDKQPEQKQWAEAVRLVFPKMPPKTSEEGGTHINISGMAMAKYAPHPKAAKALMEYLISVPAQRTYAAVNYEYPIIAGLAPDPLVQSWHRGKTLNPDTLTMQDIAAASIKASRLVDAVNFNK